MKPVFFSLVLFLSMLLNACGFQPRDTASLSASVSPVFIAGIPAYGDFYRSMRFALRSSGIEVVSERESANTVLTIRDQGVQRQLLTVDERGKGVEYLLTHLVNVSLTDNAGADLVNNRKVGVRRIWFSDGERGLASQRKRQEIEAGMVNEDLPQAIIRSLGSSLRLVEGYGKS